MTSARLGTWLAAWLLAGLAGAAPGATLHGTVVRVVDGDTVTVADGRRRKVKVRLAGIDAPEKDQPYGREATIHLTSLLRGRQVTVEWNKRDAYGRVIGRILVAPHPCPACDASQDAGLAQIASGYAWWYRSESREQSHEDKARYALAENAARAGHLGLWAAPGPVPPWDWRHARTNQASSPLARAGTRIRKVKAVVRHPVRSLHRWLNS